MIKVRVLSGLLILLLTINCSGQTGKQQSLKTAYGQQLAMEQYKKQKHRFEIRDCKFYYNEQEINFESEEAFLEMFGSNFESESNWHRYYLDKPVEFFLDVRMGKKKIYINRLNINMGRPPEGTDECEINAIHAKMPVLEGYLLFDGVLINAKTRVEDLNQQLELLDKYTVASSMGNPASHGYAFDKAYCYPGMDNSESALIFITLYYHDDFESGELFDMQTLRYEYH